MATIENLDVNLRANTLKYDPRIKKSTSVTSKFGDTAKRAAGGPTAFGSALKVAGGTATAFVATATALALSVNSIVQSFANVGDEIAKTSQQLLLSQGEYQELVYAMERSGGSSATLFTAIKGLTRSYYDLQRGLATSKAAFGELGLSIKDLQGINVADQLKLVLERIQKITDGSKRAAVAQKLFGRAGLEVLPLLNGNLDIAVKRFRKLGFEVGPQAVKTSEDIKDANLDLGLSFRKLSETIVNTFGPKIVEITNFDADLIRQTADGIDELQRKIVEFRFGIKVPTLSKVGREGFREFQEAQRRQENVRPTGDTFLSDVPKLEERARQQQAVVDALKTTANRLAPLPQALEKGSSAQIGFINNLKRQQQASEVRAREKKKIDLAEKTLEEIKNLVSLTEKEEERLRQEGNVIL